MHKNRTANLLKKSNILKKKSNIKKKKKKASTLARGKRDKYFKEHTD